MFASKVVQFIRISGWKTSLWLLLFVKFSANVATFGIELEDIKGKNLYLHDHEKKLSKDRIEGEKLRSIL